MHYSLVLSKKRNWATHRSDYRGNWSPQVVRNLILRYSQEGDTILDQMVGGGTTLIECKLTGRKGIGVDINPDAIKITQERLNFDCLYSQSRECYAGDARNLETIKDNSIDLILTHPPYADIIKYSDGRIKEDLSSIHSIDVFCDEIEKVARECFRVLKPDKCKKGLCLNSQALKIQSFLNQFKIFLIPCNQNCADVSCRYGDEDINKKAFDS